MNNFKHNKSSQEELELRKEFYVHFEESPIPKDELLLNLSLFTNKMSLSRLLFFDKIYRKILQIQGVIMEFGVYWGRDLALLQNLRGIYEPFNFNRKIIGFDTFEGLKGVDFQKDKEQAKEGAFKVSENYILYLKKVLEYHEQECPLSHIKKYELIKGDVRVSLGNYLERHPETIIALAYFDMDIYSPTKIALQLIKPYLAKGSILVFDELNYDRFPGETLAVKEVFDLSKLQLRRIEHEPVPCYVVID